MKKLTLLVCVLIAGCFYAHAQSQAEMKAWQDYMTPGEVHKMMAKWDGKWNEEISMWMTPGAPPAKSNGSCVNKMIMGGRYQESRHTSTMMNMPFEGLNILAWDNARKVFISSWIDNMGTGIMYMEGAWDAATKSITMKGKCTDPTSGKEMEVREVFKVTDDNTQVMEMYMIQNGQDFKTMEIVFKRAK